MQVGFVGLGKMGHPMAQRLLEAGHTVHVYNRSLAPVVSAGQKRRHSCRFVGRAQFALRGSVTALPTVLAVLSVYEQLAGNARTGQLILGGVLTLIGGVSGSIFSCVPG